MKIEISAEEFADFIMRQAKSNRIEVTVKHRRASPGHAPQKPVDKIDNLMRGVDGPRERNRLAVFAKVIPTLTQYDVTWIRKSDLLDAYPKSKPTAYQHFASIESSFETRKLGAYVYVRLREVRE